jgi:Glycosyl transferase family 2
MIRPRLSVLFATYNHGRFIRRPSTASYVRHSIGATSRSSWWTTGRRTTRGPRLEPYRDVITYLHQDNGGQAAAWNLELARMRGDLAAFLDADDTWGEAGPVVHEFASWPEVDVVCHAMTVVNDRGAVIGQAPDLALTHGRAHDRRPWRGTCAALHPSCHVGHLRAGRG